MLFLGVYPFKVYIANMFNPMLEVGLKISHYHPGYFTGEDVILLYFDREKLEEAISNLLSNAVKFTPAGGRIALEVKVIRARPGANEGDLLEISVSDTSPGIPREMTLQPTGINVSKVDKTFMKELKQIMDRS